MADYRNWCASCGAEITFGSCLPDCPAEAKIREMEHKRKLEKLQAEARLEDEWRAYETLEDMARALGDLQGQYYEILDVYYPLKERVEAGERFIYSQKLTWDDQQRLLAITKQVRVEKYGEEE